MFSEKKHLYCDGGPAVAEVAQRGCGPLPLEIFRTQLDLVLSAALADPAVGKSLN